jgi:hypothetical protein
MRLKSVRFRDSVRMPGPSGGEQQWARAGDRLTIDQSGNVVKLTATYGADATTLVPLTNVIQMEPDGDEAPAKGAK